MSSSSSSPSSAINDDDRAKMWLYMELDESGDLEDKSIHVTKAGADDKRKKYYDKHVGDFISNVKESKPYHKVVFNVKFMDKRKWKETLVNWSLVLDSLPDDATYVIFLGGLNPDFKSKKALPKKEIIAMMYVLQINTQDSESINSFDHINLWKSKKDPMLSFQELKNYISFEMSPQEFTSIKFNEQAASKLGDALTLYSNGGGVYCSFEETKKFIKLRKQAKDDEVDMKLAEEMYTTTTEKWDGKQRAFVTPLPVQL